MSWEEFTMYIAMNRFRILPGKEDEFETLWRKRDSHLNEVEGFKSFNLIKGQANSDYTLYVSHSQWETENHFWNWTKSSAFKKAHKNAGKNNDIYMGHPQFEGFVVIDI